MHPPGTCDLLSREASRRVGRWVVLRGDVVPNLRLRCLLYFRHSVRHEGVVPSFSVADVLEDYRTVCPVLGTR